MFGESAGSLSISLHHISPLSNGLFHRVIQQSCTAIDPGWGPITPQKALSYAGLFSVELECATCIDAPQDALTCLQGRRMADIIGLTYLLGREGDLTPWMPVPDHDFTSEPFLPGDAENLLESGMFNTEVDVIIGTNSDEGILYLLDVLADPSLWEERRNNFNITGTMNLFNIADKLDITAEDIEKAHKIVDFYVGSMNNMDESHKQGMFDMFTDSGFLYGTYKTINYLLKHGVTVYQYILSYEGEHSFTEVFGVEPTGVCHADDLIYIWDMDLGLSGDDVSVREVMTIAWTNFAKYGDPTPPGSGLSWVPRAPNVDHKYYWNISGPVPSMDSSLEIQRRMEIWNEVVG